MTTTKTAPAAAPAPIAPAVPLSAEALAVKARLDEAFDLTSVGAQEMLLAGLRAFDTMRNAERIIERDGVVVNDRYGTPKAHPAVDIARQARAQWMGCLRVLGLTAWDE